MALVGHNVWEKLGSTMSPMELRAQSARVTLHSERLVARLVAFATLAWFGTLLIVYGYAA
jgi:hypothetical protein